MSGKFIGKCSSLHHTEAQNRFPDNETDLISSSNRRKFPRSLVTWLIDTGKWQPNGKYICQSCVDYVSTIAPTLPDTPSSKKSKTAQEEESTTAAPTSPLECFSAADVVQRIENNSFTELDICQISAAIGKYSIKQIKTYACTKISLPSPDELQEATYTTTWSKPECNVYKSFVSGIVNTQLMSENKRHDAVRYMQKSLDCLCAAANSKFVSTLAHLENIVLHAFSGSKLACEIFNHCMPGGAYSTVIQNMKNYSTVAPTLPLDDFYCAFDNQQIIGREYHVTLGGGQRTSTVTSMSAFFVQNSPKLQQILQISTAIQYPIQNMLEMKEKIRQITDNYNNVHGKYRNKFLETRLQSVLKEISFANHNLESEEIQSFIKHSNYEGGLQYDIVPSFPAVVQVKNQKNLLFNPNSTTRVAQVLDTLVEMVEKSDSLKKWFVTYCDGLPYTIAHKLIQNTYACRCCSASGTKDAIESHSCEKQMQSPKIHRKYEKIVLRPGAGHFEINAVRSIFNVYFHVFIEPVAKLLNYSTPKALKYCMDAVDHHKSWQILKIIYLALGDELIYFFLTKSDPSLPKTLESLSTWLRQVKNKNYLMAFDFVFTRLHSLFLFRSGIRQTNDDVSASALFKSSAFFFGFNHPRYQQIYTQDLLFLSTLPTVAHDFIRRNALIVAESGAGQGVDMLLEEQNKEQKHWLIAHGVPTDQQWESISSNLSDLQKIKQLVLKNLGIMYGELQQRKLNLGNEYIAVRHYFRKKLNELSPTKLQTFCEPSVPLDESFINCSKTCESNQMAYINSAITGEKCCLEVIQVNPLSSQSSQGLTKIIQSSINKLPSDVKQYYAGKLIEATQEELIDIYYEVAHDVQEYKIQFLNN